MLNKSMSALAVAVAALAFAQPPTRSPAQAPPKIPPMNINEYEPKSTLVVPQHPVTRARYPLIDVHNHQDGAMPSPKLDKLVKDMDSINLQVMVNLSGGYGNKLAAAVKNMKGRYPDRFVVFAN